MSRSSFQWSVAALLILLPSVAQVSAEPRESPAPQRMDPQERFEGRDRERDPRGADRSFDLEDALARYVQSGRTRGAAAAVITPEGIETAFAGSVGGIGRSSPEASTLFEIGSVTKVFTGILLAEMVQRGEVSLEDTIGDLMPGERRLDPEVASITLRELSTHTSGLPRLPIDLTSLVRLASRPGDPYRGTTTDEILDAVAALDGADLVTRGTSAYSNLGPALLGRLLEAAAGEPYARLLSERVLSPLGMERTRMTRKVLEGPELARGHRGNLRPTGSWLLDGYDPAGGLSSNLNDMVRFLEAVLAAEGGPLGMSLEPAWTDEAAGRAAGLGWAISAVDGEPMIWHNGRTGGFYAFVGFFPRERRGVVLLTNTGHLGDPFAVGLLRGEPQAEPPEVGWFLIGFTLLMVPMAPLALWRARRRFGDTPAGADRTAGRIHLLGAGFDAALLLAITWKVGAWTVIPPWYWSLGLGAAMGFAAASILAARSIPWWPAGGPLRATGTLAVMGVIGAALWWTLFRL